MCGANENAEIVVSWITVVVAVFLDHGARAHVDTDVDMDIEERAFHEVRGGNILDQTFTLSSSCPRYRLLSGSVSPSWSTYTHGFVTSLAASLEATGAFSKLWMFQFQLFLPP